MHGEHLDAEEGALDRYAVTARELMEHDLPGHAPCSVLTVRAGTPVPEDGQFRKILVPVDFSESDHRCSAGASRTDHSG